MTIKGEHVASILLHGTPISCSPVSFVVRPAAPIAAKSWLQLRPGLPLVTNESLEAVLHLVDRYGNEADRGEVRVDAKAFGPKASECVVTDSDNGLYSIVFVASVPGDYKVQVRLENVEMQVLLLHVDASPILARPESDGSGDGPRGVPSPAATDAVGAPHAPTSSVPNGATGGAVERRKLVESILEAAASQGVASAPEPVVGSRTSGDSLTVKTKKAKTERGASPAKIKVAAPAAAPAAAVAKAPPKKKAPATQRAGSPARASAPAPAGAKGGGKGSNKTARASKDPAKKGVSFGGASHEPSAA